MAAKKGLQILATLSLVEGVATFIWLISIPTNRQIFSAARLVGLGAIFLTILTSAASIFYFRAQGRDQFNIAGKIAGSKYRLATSFLLLAIFSLFWTTILFREHWLSFISETIYIRLIPIIAYSLLMFLQAGLFLLLTKHEEGQHSGELRSLLKPTLILWVIFLSLWVFISSTHLGLIHDDVGLSWGPPGTPITFAQVQLVLVVSFLLTFAWYLIQTNLQKIALSTFSIREVILFLTLWLIAVMLWSSQPMSSTHFAPPAMPPNNETYPNSDALLFDRSSYHLLYGIGFSNQLVRRPLYAGMLAFFHEFAGGNYDNTVRLQILILALIPAFVFLLTSRLSNRMAGLVAGGLIVLRETNSIALSGEIVTSHAKLMMSDMMATLGVVIILYLTVRWLSSEKPNFLECAIIGACLGLTALVRAQVLILALPLLLFILLSRKTFRMAVQNSILITAGIILVMAPWILRNWNLTGTFVLDDRGEERLLARNYSLPPRSMPSPLPGETDEEFSLRLKSDIFIFIRTHPGDVIHFISNHFMRNLATASVYAAPTFSTDTPETTVEHLPFWDDWTGDLTANSRMAIFINLGLIALGISIAMTKNKWAGLFPLIVFLTYSFGNALVRSSGWRFNQPADWTILVYYSIALAWLPSRIKSLFTEKVSNVTFGKEVFSVKPPVTQILALSTLFLMGASVPIAEKLIPTRDFDGYTETAKVDLANAEVISAAEIDTFLEQQNAVLLSGIALYPRYTNPNSRFQPTETSISGEYLHLWLMNENNSEVILPVQTVPKDIPHTAIISVIGCWEEGIIAAYAIVVHEPSNQILVRDPGVQFTCEPNKP